MPQQKETSSPPKPCKKPCATAGSCASASRNGAQTRCGISEGLLFETPNSHCTVQHGMALLCYAMLCYASMA